METSSKTNTTEPVANPLVDLVEACLESNGRLSRKIIRRRSNYLSTRIVSKKPDDFNIT